jgi:hypothetical protein
VPILWVGGRSGSRFAIALQLLQLIDFYAGCSSTLYLSSALLTSFVLPAILLLPSSKLMSGQHQNPPHCGRVGWPACGNRYLLTFYFHFIITPILRYIICLYRKQRHIITFHPRTTISCPVNGYVLRGSSGAPHCYSVKPPVG